MSQTKQNDDRSLEAIYDEEVSPLMARIIAICKRANLPVYASFKLDEDLSCTTYIAPALSTAHEDDRESYKEWLAQHDALARGVSRSSPLMITTRNAVGDVVAVEAVL